MNSESPLNHRQARRGAAGFNQGAAANRRPAGQADGSDNFLATVAADRAFPAAVAELERYAFA